MFQVVGSGGDQLEIDPRMGERQVLGRGESQGGQERELLKVDQWIEGAVVGHQRHAQWMGQKERLLPLPDR